MPLIALTHLLRTQESQTNFVNMNELSGKHIVITGGSTGIGYEVIRKCLEQGATVS